MTNGGLVRVRYTSTQLPNSIAIAMGAIVGRLYTAKDKLLLKSIREGDGDLRLFNEALERKANVNCAFDYNWTALHWAAFKGRETMVEILLDRGARNRKNNDGNFPADIACWDAGPTPDPQLRARILRILQDASENK